MFTTPKILTGLLLLSTAFPKYAMSTEEVLIKEEASNEDFSLKKDISKEKPSKEISLEFKKIIENLKDLNELLGVLKLKDKYKEIRRKEDLNLKEMREFLETFLKKYEGAVKNEKLKEDETLQKIVQQIKNLFEELKLGSLQIPSEKIKVESDEDELESRLKKLKEGMEETKIVKKEEKKISKLDLEKLKENLDELKEPEILDELKEEKKIEKFQEKKEELNLPKEKQQISTEEKVTVEKCNKKGFVKFIDPKGEGFQECENIENGIGINKSYINGAMDEIINKSDFQLKVTGLNLEPKNIKEFLKSYKNSESETISLLGDQIKDEQEKRDIINNMELSGHIYTYPKEFNFEPNKLRDGIKNEWKKIIDTYNKIQEKITAFEDLKEEYKSGKLSKNLKKNLNERGVIIEEKEDTPDEIYKKYNKLFELLLSETNSALDDLGLKNIEAKDISKIDFTLSFLEEIFSQYSELFNDLSANVIKDGEDDSYWSYIFGKDVQHKLKPFLYSKKEYKLTHRAGLIASFLNKLSQNDDFINLKYQNVLSIGFRNTADSYAQKSYLGVAKEKMISLWKGNGFAAFNNGELDHIAFLKNKDKNTDQIIIVFAGSNSAKDWDQDTNLSTTASNLKLHVHEGIDHLFEVFTRWHLGNLINKIESMYEKGKQPKNIEFIVTGHSLGGALALLASKFLKDSEQAIKNRTNSENISIKVYTYGAPAIFAPESAQKFEEELGKKNIYRIWQYNDPVPSLSLFLGRYQHVGKSYPILDLSNLGYKTAGFISAYLGMTGEMHQFQRYGIDLESNLGTGIKTKELNEKIDKIITGTHFKEIKKLDLELNKVANFISTEKEDSIQITPELRERLLFKVEKPIISTIGETDINSPRVIKQGKVFFGNTPLKSIEVKIKGITGYNNGYTLTIDPSTTYDSDKLKNILVNYITKKVIPLSNDELSRIQCQLSVAQHVFLQPWQGTFRTYKKGPLDTITELSGNNCDELYLQKTYKTVYKDKKSTDPLIIIGYILGELGLTEQWQNIKVNFKEEGKKEELGYEEKVYNPFEIIIGDKFKNNLNKLLTKIGADFKNIAQKNIEEIDKEFKEFYEQNKKDFSSKIDSEFSKIYYEDIRPVIDNYEKIIELKDSTNFINMILDVIKSKLSKNEKEEEIDEKINGIYEKIKLDNLTNYKIFLLLQKINKLSKSLQFIRSDRADISDKIDKKFEEQKKDILTESRPKYLIKKIEKNDSKEISNSNTSGLNIDE